MSGSADSESPEGQGRTQALRPAGPAAHSAREPSSGQFGDAAPFEQIARALPAALYATDAEGRITFFNDAAATLWGRRPEIGVDRWCGSWRLYFLDGRPMAPDECPMAVTVKTGRPLRGVEAVAERPDGSRSIFLAHPTPLFDDQGALTGAVNVLVDITGYKEQTDIAERLAAIVASSDDAIVSKTLDGTIISWNEGAERLFGYAPDEIVGHSILTLIPPDRHGEETEIVRRLRRGGRLEHFETVRLHKSGRPIDISLTVSPVKRADGTIVGASKIARDISGRKKAEAQLQQQAYRLETLNRVSQVVSNDLDLHRIVQSVTDIATELSGARFGAFFYNVMDEGGEAYQLYTLSGAPREAFENFGMPRNTAVFGPTFAGVAVVRSGDIRQDPRYGQNPPHYGMPKGHLPVVSYLAVPVVSPSGEVLGGLFLGHDEPGRFQADTEDLISAIARQTAVAMDNARRHQSAEAEIQQRRRAEEAKELLLHELQHRVKNTLATIQGMVAQTFRGAPREEREAFVARLQALAAAHDLLTQQGLTEQGQQAIEVGSVVTRALRPFGDDPQRIAAAGPDVRLNSNGALLLAMVLHELGTNAVKYGALSTSAGRVDITWETFATARDARLRLVWRESGGPVVTPPDRKGFGSLMIERALRGQQGSASFEFAAEGVVCALEIVALGSGV